MAERKRDPNREPDQVLLLRCGGRFCAVPLRHVVETMREQPLRALPDMPEYLAGVSIIRGKTLPVIRLAALLGEPSRTAARRLVVIESGERQAALSTEAVLGVISLDRSSVESLPLLKEIRPELISGIGRLDRELLIVLETFQIVPAEVWHALESGVSP